MMDTKDLLWFECDTYKEKIARLSGSPTRTPEDERALYHLSFWMMNRGQHRLSRAWDWIARYNVWPTFRPERQNWIAHFRLPWNAFGQEVYCDAGTVGECLALVARNYAELVRWLECPDDDDCDDVMVLAGSTFNDDDDAASSAA